MQALKKAIPAALVLAFAGAAQAQVTVYGLIDMSYGKNELLPMVGGVAEEKAKLHSGGDGGGNGGDFGNSTTRFGLKGSTDVGSGVKANFKLESAAIDSNGGQGANAFLFGRQAWLGFSGGFGEVRVGRQDSVPFQAMGDFDFNGQSNGVTSAYAGVGVWATGRQSRSIQYMSPNVSGFSAHAGVQINGKDDPEAAGFNGTDQKDTGSIALKYSAGPLLVGAAFEGKRTDTGDDFSSVAASYDFKVVKVMAGYSDLGDNNKGPTLGVVAPVAGFTVGAHWAKNTKDTDKPSVLELFVNKEVFKNTYGYAEVGRLSSEDNTLDGNTSYSVGVIYVF